MQSNSSAINMARRRRLVVFSESKYSLIYVNFYSIIILFCYYYILFNFYVNQFYISKKTKMVKHQNKAPHKYICNVFVIGQHQGQDISKVSLTQFFV